MMTFVRTFPELAHIENDMRRVFDPDFYRQRLGDTVDGDLLVHYLQEGWRKGLDPHPLFSTNYYLASNAQFVARDENPLLHYFQSGASQLRPFHPLFDVRAYVIQTGTVVNQERNVLLHYLQNGPARALELHPLFDREYYVTHSGVPTSVHDPLLHYLTVGYREGRNPHLLFDVAHYYAQAPDLQKEGVEPLGHFMTAGWRVGLDPHPLFSTSHYLSCNPDVVELNTCPLLHFVTQGARERRSFHPLFSPDYYVAESRARDREVSWKPNLLLDYLESGWRAGLGTSPFFDIDFYKSVSGVTDFEPHGPLVHYLTRGYREGIDPHPAFDTTHYFRTTESIRPGFDNALLHFLRHGDRASPMALFDTNWYLATYSDIRQWNLSPGRHYLEHGFQENRRPNALHSQQYVLNLCPDVSFVNDHYLAVYRRRRIDKRKRVLFVGHEASRTGAPLILLQILKHFSSMTNVECFVILDRGGPLVGEFAKFAHLYMVQNHERAFLDGMPYSDDLTREMHRVLALLEDNPPVAVVANSAEVTHLANRVAERFRPLIFLVHESGQFYGPAQIELMLRCCDKVVFPARAMLESYVARNPGVKQKAIVLPQGLLKSRFGDWRFKRKKEHLCKDHGIPREAFVVLGCGTVDLRKGTDLFVSVATAVLRKVPSSMPVVFVWVGGGSDRFGSLQYYLKLQLRNGGLDHRILFVGEQDDPEPFFLAADVFLLTSRVDPFPCVVHEAMACGLPTIAFTEGGGAPEAIADSGFVVDGFDVAAAADRVMDLLHSRELREACSARAKHRVTSLYNFNDYVKAIRSMIEEHVPGQPCDLGESPSDRSTGKIVLATPDWSLSGVNSFAVCLIRNLVEAGYDAELVFTRGRFTYVTDESTRFDVPGVPIRFLQPVDNRPESIWAAVREYLEANAPCIFVPNFDYVASTVGANLASDIGIIGIVHSDDQEHYEHMRRLGLFWNRIVAVSERIRQEAVAVNASYESKMSMIRYGVPIDDREPSRVRSDLTVLRPLTIVYAGRLVQKQKRVLDFVDLARQLEKAGLQYKLILIGEGEDGPALESRLADLIGRGTVEMPGRVEHGEMKLRYECADVFTLLSDFEGLPVALLEAMERGCIPIVSEMESGIPEVICSGENGFVFPRGDFVRYSEILRDLTENPTRRAEIADRARKTIVERFSETLMVQQYRDVIDGVLEEIRTGDYERPRPAQYLDPITTSVWPSASIVERADSSTQTGATPQRSNDQQYTHLVERIRDTVKSVIPADATVIVVSKGDDELLRLGGRDAWHFPRTEDGVYAGHYPSDSGEAIRHLEELRAQGASFLLFPHTALWWLDYYKEFKAHLESRYRVVVRQERTCVIFALRTSGVRAHADWVGLRQAG